MGGGVYVWCGVDGWAGGQAGGWVDGGGACVGGGGRASGRWARADRRRGKKKTLTLGGNPIMAVGYEHTHEHECEGRRPS